MKHEVNLSLYTFYTDIALESLEYNNMQSETEIKNIDDVIITKIKVDKKTGKIINKKEGNYTTIEFQDITDSTNKESVINALTKELKHYINIKKDDLVLIVGLGNELSTPDSLGPKCIDNIIVTNHIYELNMLDDNYNRVSLLKPGVYGKTGIETSIIIDSICKRIKPSLVIVIDSLCSGSVDRLNRTIQITDTGINPGSGIGNKRKEISKQSLDIPVIAIGVPTVVSLINIINDVLIEIKYNKKIKNQLKEDLDLIVTPTEIDYIIECLTQVISTSINNIFIDKTG